MRKIFLALGLVAGLCLTVPSPSQASTHTTFTGGMGCTCQDEDNWADAMKPSSVTLSCPGLGAVVYRDTFVSNSVLKEYSCSSFSGATSVSTDNLSGKVMVSSVNMTCPRGYMVKTVQKAVKTQATALKTSTVSVAYCAPAIAPVAK